MRYSVQCFVLTGICLMETVFECKTCMCKDMCAHACICVFVCVCAHGNQKMDTDPLKVELQLPHDMGVRVLGVLCKSSVCP